MIQLLEKNSISFSRNEPLYKYTTWKIGGDADLFIDLNSIDELKIVFPFLHCENIPYFIIGKGSNILIPDEGIRGVVLKLSGKFENIEFNHQSVTAGAGASFIRLCLLSAKEGLSGLEFGAGIPGSVGGAVRMNAGAHGSDLSNVLKCAKIITDNGNLIELQNGELQFSYRSSLLNEKPWMVYEATFSLVGGDTHSIAEKTSAFKSKRMQTQPLKLPSCGSVFKNPLPEYAGNLIEKCGLKGYRHGNAQISDLHGNFIVNHGGAKASDVLALIETAQKQVKETFDIDLVPEVKILKNFQEVHK